jgi:glycosyltransferase involved in cell wall biosynthesis
LRANDSRRERADRPAIGPSVSARQPAISVVVPTKGRLSSLERCLEALCQADFAPERFEVVIANDHGGEQVDSLVASFEGRIDVAIARPERTGPSAARNAGAATARGDYVAFTDDDCEPTRGWLAALERSLAASPGAAAGGTVENGMPENLGAVATQVVVDALHAHFNRDPRSPRFFASSNVAFPAEAFRSMGGFDEGFRYAEDREVCERWILTGHRFVSAPDAVVIHMRTQGLRDFAAQHYGYGRGARAFQRTQPAEERRTDRSGVLRELARSTLRRHGHRSRLAVGAYVVLSQLATAAGFAHTAITSRALPPRSRRA